MSISMHSSKIAINISVGNFRRVNNLCLNLARTQPLNHPYLDGAQAEVSGVGPRPTQTIVIIAIYLERIFVICSGWRLCGGAKTCGSRLFVLLN